MKWSTKTWAAKREAKGFKQCEWHRWFAWRLVELTSPNWHNWRWLEYVERKWRNSTSLYASGYWEYRDYER